MPKYIKKWGRGVFKVIFKHWGKIYSFIKPIIMVLSEQSVWAASLGCLGEMIALHISVYKTMWCDVQVWLKKQRWCDICEGPSQLSPSLNPFSSPHFKIRTREALSRDREPIQAALRMGKFTLQVSSDDLLFFYVIHSDHWLALSDSCGELEFGIKILLGF